MIYKIYVQWLDGRANGYWLPEPYSTIQRVEKHARELNDMFGEERWYEVRAHQIIEI